MTTSTQFSHNEISARYREILAPVLRVKEDDIPPKPWSRIIYDFAEEHHGVWYKYDPFHPRRLDAAILKSIARNL